MTASKWAAEIEVGAALARSLIVAQFHDLRDARVEPFGVGWDNTAFLVDGALVFRFPRRAAVVSIMEREIRCRTP